MRLDRPLLKLPIRFDPDALAGEVRALPDWAWSAHPTGFVGNEAVRLISPGGEQTDEFSGPIGPDQSSSAFAPISRRSWERSAACGAGAA